MSTRSFIGIVNPDGSVSGVYCHYDGYLEGVGALLRQHYNTPEIVRDLLALGDISSLGPTLDSSDFYHRDRKEEMSVPFKYASLELGNTSEQVGFEFWYVFSPKGWLWRDRNSQWKPLTDV